MGDSLAVQWTIVILASAALVFPILMVFFREHVELWLKEVKKRYRDRNSGKG